MYFHQLKIGNLTLKSNIFIAPLAGYTTLPSRLIYRKQGIGIAYSEMISALGLKNSYDKSIRLIASKKKDTPLGVQLFGPDADSILDAFLRIKDRKFDIIDINCGCSVKKVLSSKAGAFLLQSPEEIYKIIYSLKQNCDNPVTIKIRSGWDNSKINYFEILEAAESAKADLITFHPRTRKMLFKGKADWEQIKLMKEKSNIPIIGNGDIFTGDDAVNMIKSTGCDGIMLARGVIENPFLIEEVKYALKGKKYPKLSKRKRIKSMIKHCKAYVEYFGEKVGVTDFRKFVRGYTKGLPNISKLRQELNTVESFGVFKSSVNEYLKNLK